MPDDLPTALPATAPSPPAWLRRVCEGSEAGDLVLRTDWAATPLGPPGQWSAGLRAAVGVCLTSHFPMLVVWGPSLTKIYNDGYRSMLGDKHPKAMGAPVATVWPEIWDVIGPMFTKVLRTGRPTWEHHQRLDIERAGFTEECYFVYSYSPLFDDDGSIGGVLDVVTESTAEVLSVRRLACLTDLGRALMDASQVTEVCLQAVRALARAPHDVRSAVVHLRVDDRLVAIASSSGVASTADADVLRSTLEHRRPVTLGDDGPTRPATSRLVPIGNASIGVEGVLAVELSPSRPFDHAYEGFVQVLATTVGSALVGAHRRAVELGEYRRIGDTLQRAMLKPAVDLPTIASRYRAATGNLSVGGDWYDVIDLDAERRAIVVGDCVGHGLDAATAMAQLRSAARAMLLDGGDPAGVLEGLDLFARSVDGAAFATVVCAVFDRVHATVTYARAGHPPPLVVSGDDAAWLDGAGGPPLCVRIPGRVRTNAQHPLRGGDLVVLYTDGLIERRREGLDAGLERLAAAVVGARHASVQLIADEVLRTLLPDGAEDDVVLVVKRLPED